MKNNVITLIILALLLIGVSILEVQYDSIREICAIIRILDSVGIGVILHYLANDIFTRR